MTTTPTETAGNLQRLARSFSNSLERGNQAAAQDMLAAWSDAYWGVRTDLDDLIAYVAQARADGQPISPSWLSRERRLRVVLAQALTELERYAAMGAQATEEAQERALEAAQDHAPALVRQAVTESLTGLSVDLAVINPDLIQAAVGFLQDGTPLAQHMTRTVARDAAAGLRDVLVEGLSKGWGQPKLVKAFTDRFAVAHCRAVTIMRTESLRVYRETSRATYAANSDVLGSWTWQCALDRRSCPACVMMHGTRHPLDEALDGHPRCRCAMIPNTKTWAELGLDPSLDSLGGAPAMESGVDWFLRQSAAYQRASLGPLKYDAWRAGEFDLPDVVARKHDPDWGTMRLERSLKSIRANRHANYGGLPDG